MTPRNAVGFSLAFSGASLFCLVQFFLALAKLGQSSSAMDNKFSALARDKYIGFLIWQNAQVLIAYLFLALVFAFLLQPFASMLCHRFGIKKTLWRLLSVVIGAFLIHAFFMLRLVETRPYFLSDAKFGHWYYELLNAVPQAIKRPTFFLLFTILPIAVAGCAAFWHWLSLPWKWRWVCGSLACAITGFLMWKSHHSSTLKFNSRVESNRLNVILIGSDSLRGDRLGCNGYVPSRSDGLAAGGVSPQIDALATRSVNLTNCFTPIASTLESNTSLMSSQYPHTHGLRQMYPDEETVIATRSKIEPLALVLSRKGYDTAAFGDWCAGFYDLMPMGFQHISVSSFDNFKIYMSQAVIMAHFVIPLYFDHPAGYTIFPQLGSFANFVTPEVVTGRVKDRMVEASANDRPFFWHVFYSCNHLPYRSPAPYSTMFADPEYTGPNRNGVDFDIDEFIGGTDLENKWKALPEQEIRQISNLYDGCTRQFDDNVGELLDALKINGLAKNTIVIITSDHGDNLYEEGVTLGHGLTFNGGLQANHVPLILHLPGAEAREIPALIRTIDIAPTIADLLGAEKPSSWEGHSFSHWLDGSEPPRSRALYAETGFPFVQFRVPGIVRPTLPPMDEMTDIEEDFNYQFVMKNEWQEPLVDAKQRCLLTDEWKLICTPAADGTRHFSLFSRKTDSGEGIDVSRENPEIFSNMKVSLERWMDSKVETPAERIFGE